MNQFAEILAAVQDILRTDSGGDETVEAVRSSWTAGLQVLIRKTREGKLVAYVPSNELNNVFTEEQLELLADAGITEDGGDSRRITLGGLTVACIGFDYDKLRLEAKTETDSETYPALKAQLVRLQRELELAKHANKADSALVRLLDTLTVQVASRGQSSSCEPRGAVIRSESQLANGVPTLLLSNWDWGDVSNEVGTGETYNVDIAQRRAKHVFTNVCESLTGDGAYEGFVCALGGNLLSTSARQSMTDNEFVDVVLALHDSLLQGIRWLSEQFGHVYVPCVSSGRLAENGDNLDWLLYRMLERSFAADTCNVKFDISGQQDLRFDVYGTRYLLTGADRTNQGAPRAPGRCDYDYLVCGHVDAVGTANGRITNGTLQGTAPGRSDNGIKVSKQSLWVTHPQFGVTKQIPVFGEVPTAPMHLPPAISSYSRTCN